MISTECHEVRDYRRDKLKNDYWSDTTVMIYCIQIKLQ